MSVERVVSEFVWHLRRRGVRISSAETLDALRALSHVDLTRPDAVLSAYQVTLGKNAGDQQTIATLFRQFYLLEAHTEALNAPLESVLTLNDKEKTIVEGIFYELLGPHAAWLKGWFGWDAGLRSPTARRSGDIRSARRKKLANHALDRALAQMRQVGVELERQLGDRGRVIARMLERTLQLNASTMGLAGLPVNGRHASTHVASSVGSTTLATPVLKGADWADPRMRLAIAAQLKRAQLTSKVSVARSGAALLDLRATVRSAARTGGLPLKLRYGRLRRRAPSLVVMCDVSPSVQPVLPFFLELCQLLAREIKNTHIYFFVDTALDVTRPFKRLSATALTQWLAAHPLLRSTALTHYGRVFDEVARLPVLSSRATLLVLGDARSNYHAWSGASFSRVKRRVRRWVWFNPDEIEDWGAADSLMLRVIPYCDEVHRVHDSTQFLTALRTLKLW